MTGISLKVSKLGQLESSFRMECTHNHEVNHVHQTSLTANNTQTILYRCLKRGGNVFVDHTRL